MPTPFQHLVYANTILESPRLPANIRERLYARRGAFLFGNTAGDVQAITGQRRSETHFYHVFAGDDTPAGDTLLAAYPELASPHRLPAAHAAFISGYLTHLVWDQLWLQMVFRPFYLDSDLWPDRLTRNVHHNAFRVLADREAEAALRTRPEIPALLHDVHPTNWLPFVADTALERWRDWLVEQLHDATTVQTAQVFAQRMGISPEHLENVALSIALDTYRPTVPGLTGAVAAHHARALELSIDTLIRYWQPRNTPNAPVTGISESTQRTS